MSDAYREPARETSAEPPRVVGTSLASAAMLGTAAMGGVAGAALLGSLELAALAAAGACAAVTHLARARRRRRLEGEVARFLGDSIVVEPGAWTSADGRRRVRVALGDDHARFERLDPASDVTLTSHRARVDVALVAAERRVLERHEARAFGRPLRPCCFDGLGPSATLRDPRTVSVESCASGVLVRRLDAHGELIGDTWHASPAAARRQLARELGAHLGVSSPPRRSSAPVPAASWEPGADARVAI
ncbi:MAG: hypothetical protein RID81_36585 [Sandaracinaceae bacterium]